MPPLSSLLIKQSSWRRWEDKWMLGHQTQPSGKRSALLQFSTWEPPEVQSRAAAAAWAWQWWVSEPSGWNFQGCLTDKVDFLDQQGIGAQSPFRRMSHCYVPAVWSEETRRGGFPNLLSPKTHSLGVLYRHTLVLMLLRGVVSRLSGAPSLLSLSSLTHSLSQHSQRENLPLQQLDTDRQTLREARNGWQPNLSSCSGQRDKQQHSWSICCYPPSKKWLISPPPTKSWTREPFIKMSKNYLLTTSAVELVPVSLVPLK